MRCFAGRRIKPRKMNRQLWLHLQCTFFLCIFSSFVVTTNSSELNQAGVLQCLENEVWDATANLWKASGERWTNEKGQSSLSPSEINPPAGFEFEGDWKIVMSGGDSLGWEYSYQYLRPPKRRRIWLRSLKEIKQLQPTPITTPSLVDILHHRQIRSLARALGRVRDDFNFKGFGLSLYKSLLSPSSCGIAFRLPLSMNFDTWERHPELPNLNTNVCFMFPWAVGAFLSGSVHLEWVKYVTKSLLKFTARLIFFAVYQVVLPLLWIVPAAILSPTKYRLPPIPKAPTLTISKPVYNADLSERIGCSVSYRWSQERGLEWRFTYWHSYLPTLALYRKVLRLSAPADFWQKHFGSIGLSTVYPVPLPSKFSTSAHLQLSGLYFQAKQGDRRAGEMTAIVKNEQEGFDPAEEKAVNARQPEPMASPRIVSTSSAKSVT